MDTLLKTLGEELGEAATMLADVFADKKVSFFEGIKLGIGLAGFGSFVSKNFNLIKDSIADGFSEEERAMLHEGFCKTFDLKNDSTEESVELYFNQALLLAQTLVSFA